MKRTFQRLWRYAKPARAAFLLGTAILSFRYFCINYMTAYLISRIAQAAQRLDVSGLARDTARFALFLVPFTLADAAARFMHDMSTQRIGNDLRERAYASILHAPLWQAEMLGASRGQVLSRLNNDMNAVESLYRFSLLSPLIFGIAGVGAFVSIWLVRPSIAVYLLALGAGSFALQSRMSKGKKQVLARIQGLLASLLTAAGECLTYGPAIRLMHVQDGVLRHAQRRCEPYLAAGGEDAAIQGGAEMVSGGASMLQYVGVMLLSIGLMARGQIDAAQILYILGLSGMVVSGFTLMGNALIALRGYLPALERVEEILNMEKEQLHAGLPVGDAFSQAEIRADDAVLCLSPQRRLTIWGEKRIPAGRSCALCGASGCGKTSFVKTLMGFYPYEGSITLAGVPLKDYAKRDVREQIAYLSQQSMIVEGSVLDNLRVGCRREATEEEIREALRICTCEDWVSELPDGVHTRLEEGGLRLSGGQRQMLVIARALLRGSPILIMDESFSAIDKLRAVRILENIRRAYPEKTILLVSHEEEMIGACDCRLCMEA